VNDVELKAKIFRYASAASLSRRPKGDLSRAEGAFHVAKRPFTPKSYLLITPSTGCG